MQVDISTSFDCRLAQRILFVDDSRVGIVFTLYTGIREYFAEIQVRFTKDIQGFLQIFPGQLRENDCIPSISTS